MLCLLDQDSEIYLNCLKRFEEIYQPYIEGDTLETVFGAVEYIITFVGSARGNRGEFDQADAYSFMLARESLYFYKKLFEILEQDELS